MPRALRSVLPLVVIAALSLALVACDGGDEDGEEDPTASPIVPTATITLTASPEPTETPSADGAGDESQDERRTGDPELDAILAAVEARDVEALASLVEVPTVACTTAQGLGGPPKCEPHQAHGDAVEMFPYSMCEGAWTRFPVQLLGQFAHDTEGAWAVARVDQYWPSTDGWAVPDHFLFFHLTDGQAGDAGAYLEVAGGRIVRASWICGGGLEGILGVDALDLEVTAGPWEQPVESQPTPPTAGIEPVDEVLRAVATYDWPALREGAMEAMQSLPPVECSEPPLQGPGGVECNTAKGETVGTPISVFPVAYCEGDLVRDPGDVLRSILDQVPTVHAVVELPSKPPQSELYPHGAYWVVYDLQGRDGGPDHVRLHLTEEGNVTVVWFGCQPPIEELLLLEGQPLPEIEVSRTLE